MPQQATAEGGLYRGYHDALLATTEPRRFSALQNETPTGKECTQMANHERIKYFRKRRGITQKNLGIEIGLDKDTADVRMAQYECGYRVPKTPMVHQIAQVLDVNSTALNVPDLKNLDVLLHTLFYLEDVFGFQITSVNGNPGLLLDVNSGELYEKLNEWFQIYRSFLDGSTTRDEYDRWRYTYGKESKC